MKQKSPELLVTGGLGFIGSAFVGRQLGRGIRIVNVDLNTYAGDPNRVPKNSRLMTVVTDVAGEELRDLVVEMRPKKIVHFAAESHVTRSESDAKSFFRTNVLGTRRVLEAAEAAGTTLVVHISTDEVYGPCAGAPFLEDEKAKGEGKATSAYARSKAVADDLAQDFRDRIPVIVARPTNCFGPWQHPEKAVARWTTRALQRMELPVWGDGKQIRDWMYVDDVCRGIETVMERGKVGEVYNIGPQGESKTNFEVATAVARAAGLGEAKVYLTAYDRPQHDRRYAIDSSKLRSLGWSPSVSFDTAVRLTVEWYETNRSWWSPLLTDAEQIYSDAERAIRR